MSSWQGLVWRQLRHPFLGFTSLAPRSPSLEQSGGLLQGIDNLLENIGAVIGYLLENGVGEFLQLCIIPFDLLQLVLKLKGKGEESSGRVQPIRVEWGLIRREGQSWHACVSSQC